MASDDGNFLVSSVEKYGKLYATWFLEILTSPERVIQRTRNAGTAEGEAQFLIPVLLVSVFLGATLGALIPDRPPLLGRATIFCVVAILWVFMSLLVHGICRLFGGKEGILITLSLMIQNLAFVYVVSNFLTLILTWLALAYPPFRSLMTSRALFSSPGIILFTLQFLLLLYLVPVTVSKAHGFRGYRWILVAVFAACFAVFFGVPVFSMGGC